MSREILFRGKDCKNGNWCYGFLTYTPHGHHPQIIVVTSSKSIYIDVIPETVGQYTGLKDKNGMKIFEGDIVKYIDKYGQEVLSYTVEWSKDSCMFFLKCIGFDDRYNSDFDVFYGEPEPFEVIGNIHDNPELVRKDKGNDT